MARQAKKARWDENRYHCEECEFKTCRPGRLKSHMESKHPPIGQRLWEEDLEEEEEQVNIVFDEEIKQVIMQRIIDLFICLSFYLYLLSTYIFHYYFRRMTLRESSMLNQEQNASKIFFYSVFQKKHLPPIFFLQSFPC